MKQPKSVSKRCQALSCAGNQCSRNDTKPIRYHGDGELYSYWEPEPTWVKVYLCSKHRKSITPIPKKEKP